MHVKNIGILDLFLINTESMFEDDDFKFDYYSIPDKSKNGKRNFLSKHAAVNLKRCQFKHCRKSFRDEEVLKRHEEVWHKDEDLDWLEYADIENRSCMKCGYKSKDGKRQLSRHIKAHHLGGSVCPLCGATVKRMKDHNERMHTEDHQKKFVCQTCGKGFLQNNQLKHHVDIVHLKLKPYQCKYCEKAFGDNVNRRTHEKVVHKKRTENEK